MITKSYHLLEVKVELELSEHWPNFFIAGVHKAGTTSLYEYLRKVPQIYMSPFK